MERESICYRRFYSLSRMFWVEVEERRTVMAYYSYDNSKRINLYKQITPTGCAVTCAAMCVRQSPETLRADGFNINVVEN